MRLAAAAVAAGRFRDAKRLCEEVTALAREEQDGRLLSRAALIAGSALLPGSVDRSLVALLTEALAALGPEEVALRCRVEARLAGALQPAPDPEVPMAMARDAIARARESDDEDLLLHVLFVAGAALVDFGNDGEQRSLAEELRDRAIAAGDLPKALRACTRLAIHQMNVGGTEWEDTVDRALELAAEVGHPRHRWPALLLASGRAVVRGDFATSEGYVAEVQQLAALTDDPALARAIPAHLGQRARLLHRDDELGTMSRSLDRLMADVPTSALVATVIRLSALTRIEDEEAIRTELARVRGGHRPVESPRFFGAVLAEACALAGTDEERRRWRTILAPYADRGVSGGNIQLCYDGPVRRVVALLDSSLGDHASAEAALRRSLAEFSERRGHPTIVAQLEYDLARVLARAEKTVEARGGFERAASLAEDLEMPGLVARAGAKAVTSQTPAAKVAAVVQQAPSRPAFGVSRDGETWRVVYGSHTATIKDSRGVELLARLVERPREELHVLALANDEGGALVEDDDGPAVDTRALRAYRERLADLDAALAEAESHTDLGRRSKLRDEREALMAELRRVTGRRGRPRAAASAAERARVNVQRRLKDAITRIGEASPEIARYLERAIRTGTYCSFRP